MRINKVYGVIAVLAVLAVLLPSKSIFAKAETSSSRDRVENNESEIDNIEQENDDDDESESGTIKREENEEDEAENHRSAVSSFVKNLLEVADRNENGIGEEVRVIAKEQEDAKEKVAKAVEEVENRSWIKVFLIGTDYKNIGAIRSEWVKTQNRIDKLDRLLETMTTSTDSVTTAAQIQALSLEETKLENFLKQNESRFSLFGWFVRLFNK